MALTEHYENLEENHIDTDGNVNDTEIEDDYHTEEEFSIERYNVSSYGWDSDVEGLVKMLIRDDIYAPGFQRGFVWNRAQQSSFIESIILGLPTPNIFLAQDPTTQKLNIVDGLQRLTTLREYLSGKFSLSGDDIKQELKGKYYPAGERISGRKAGSALSAADTRTLENAVIRAIIIRPDPKLDDSDKGHEYNAAIIQIFKRLNTGGSQLKAQEIRASVLHGKFNDLLGELNNDSNWRELFGKKHSRQRDMEIILRTIALIAEGDSYKSPMSRFLDAYMGRARNMESHHVNEIKDYYHKIMRIMNKTLGRDRLRSGNAFLVSKLDTLAVGLHQYVLNHDHIDESEIMKMTEELEHNDEFRKAASGFINHTDKVSTRLRLAKEIFSA